MIFWGGLLCNGSPPFIKSSEKYKWNVRTVRGTMGSGKFEVYEYSIEAEKRNKMSNEANVNIGNSGEYFDGGVSYCVGIDKIDGAVSLDFAIKKCLLEMEAIVSSEMKIVITPIKYPRDEIKNLCTEWHLNEQICNKMLSLIDEDTKLYRCCDDYEYISKGVIGEIFRIIEKGQERILVDFYVVD